MRRFLDLHKKILMIYCYCYRRRILLRHIISSKLYMIVSPAVAYYEALFVIVISPEASPAAISSVILKLIVVVKTCT